METIYLKTTLSTRPRSNVIDFQSYREQRGLLMEGTTGLPDRALLSEITPELPEPSAGPLERFTQWADAVASVVLSLGALLILAALL